MTVRESHETNIEITADPIIQCRRYPHSFYFEVRCKYSPVQDAQFRLELMSDSKEYKSQMAIRTNDGRLMFQLGGQFGQENFSSVVKHTIGVPYFLWVKLPREKAEWLVKCGTLVLAGQPLSDTERLQWTFGIQGRNDGTKEVRGVGDDCRTGVWRLFLSF